MATSVSDSYTIPGALNFKRIKNQGESTTIETKSSPGQRSRLMEQMRKFKCIENFIKHKLYHKYASSQNYYYLKDINSILNEERTQAVIEYKDQLSMQVRDEQLKKLYRTKEYKSQIGKLTEYYKYHKEIPRIFAKEVYDTFFDHHDQKRKAEFVVITKKLREDAGENVKAELEQALKKLRETKYQALLADLKPYVAAGYKNKPTGESKPATGNTSQSGYSLQQKLNDIFTQQADLSLSQFSIKSATEEAEILFSKHLRSSLGSKELPAAIPAISFKKPGFGAKQASKPAVILDVRAEAEYNPSGSTISPAKLAGRNPIKLVEDRSVKLFGPGGNAVVPSREVSRQGSTSNTFGKSPQQGLISVRQLSLGQVSSTATNSQSAQPTAKFMNSVIRASLSPEIVASLKKIQLPSDDYSKQRQLQSQEQLHSGPTSPGISIKPVSFMNKPLNSGTGAGQQMEGKTGGKSQPLGGHSRTSSQVSRVVGEGSQVSLGNHTYVRKPTGTQYSSGNGHHTTTSRGINLVKNGEEVVDPLSSMRNSSGGFRREGSDFRITKKSSMEEMKVSPPKPITSKRNNPQPYLFTEKDHVIGAADENFSSPPISLDLMGVSSQNFSARRAPSLTKLNYDSKAGAPPMTTASKHQKQNSLNGPNVYSARRVNPTSQKSTQSNFDIAGSIYGSGSTIQKVTTQISSLSNRNMPSSSNLEAINFKMNIDRLVRASGAIDFKSVAQGTSSGFASVHAQNSIGQSAQQLGYLKSQNNTYQNFMQPPKMLPGQSSGLKHKHSKSQPLGNSRENSAAASSSRLGSQVLLIKPSPGLTQVANMMGSEFSSTIRVGYEQKQTGRGLSSAHKLHQRPEGEYSTAKLSISKGSTIGAGTIEGEMRNKAGHSLGANQTGADMRTGGSVIVQNAVSKNPFNKKASVSEFSGPSRHGTSSGAGSSRPTGGYLATMKQEERPAYAKKEIKLVKKTSHQKTGSTNF